MPQCYRKPHIVLHTQNYVCSKYDGISLVGIVMQTAPSISYKCDYKFTVNLDLCSNMSTRPQARCSKIGNSSWIISQPHPAPIKFYVIETVSNVGVLKNSIALDGATTDGVRTWLLTEPNYYPVYYWRKQLSWHVLIAIDWQS